MWHKSRVHYSKVSAASNEVLNLTPKLSNGITFWEELENIKNSLECLGILVNKLDSPSLSHYFKNQYAPFVTFTAYDAETKRQQLKFEQKN